MAEQLIDKGTAEKYAKKAAEVRNTNTNITGPMERFNVGLPLLDKKGRPTTEAHNAGVFVPKETNEAGVNAARDRLSEEIENTVDPVEKAQLERIRQNLKVEALAQPPLRTNEQGDYVRKTPEVEEIADPETGQVFRFVRYNWDNVREGEPVTVDFPPYNNRVDDAKPTQTRFDELAEQMPDHPFIAFMHPGMGSDKLTDKQRKQLGGPESYFAIADAQLRIIKGMGVDTINVAGHSMGAFAGLALATRAAEQEVKVNTAVLISLPGVEEMPVQKLAKALGAGGKYLRTHSASPFDPYMYEAASVNLPINPDVVKFGITTPINDPIWYGFPYARAMAIDTASERLVTVLNTQPDCSITLIGGTEDGVSPSTATNKIIRDFRKEGYGSDRLSSMLFSGGSHAFLENPLRFAATVKEVLTSQHAKPPSKPVKQ